MEYVEGKNGRRSTRELTHVPLVKQVIGIKRFLINKKVVFVLFAEWPMRSVPLGSFVICVKIQKCGTEK